MIRFDVLGEPVAKGSYRAINVRGRAILVPSGDNERKAKSKTWDQAVRAAAIMAAGAAGYDLQTPAFVETPVRVILNFRLRRPAGHWGKNALKPSAPATPSTKPDIDKLARAVLDSLTGIIYDDDSRVAELLLHKLFANPGDEGATILVESLAD